MTFISSFFKLSLEELKRRTTEIIVIFLVFFITQPVFAIIDTMSQNKRNYYTEFGISTYSEFNANLLEKGSLLIFYFIVLYGIISALRSFSYLFSKKKTDFYHSLPIKRELYFIVKYISGIVIILVPYLINLLAASIIVWMRTNEFTFMIIECNFHILYFLLTYSFTVLAVMLTGNAIVSIITSIGLSSYAMIIQLIINSNLDLFFITYTSYNFNSSFFEKTAMLSYFWMVISSFFKPYQITRIFNSIGTLELSLSSVKLDVILILILFMLIAILSMFLYVKRPIESSGKSFIFKWMERIFKYFISIPCAFLLGIILFFSAYDFKLYAIGVIAGAIIIPCILEAIYHLDIKKAFSHIAEMFIITAVSILLVLAIRYDWFNYNNYLPDKDNVESISISINERGYNNYLFGNILSDKSFVRSSPTDYQLTHTEMKNSALTYPVIEAAITDTKSISTEEWIKNYTYRYRLTTDYTTLYVKYKLKNGKEVYRTYYMKLNDNIDVVNNLITNEEYYKNAYPIYKLEEYIDEITLNTVLESTLLNLSNEEKVELIRIYQEEFGALGIDYLNNDVVIGELELLTNTCFQGVQHSRITSIKSLELIPNLSTISSYPIYSSFKNTIKYIKRKGYEIQEIHSGQVIMIQLSVYGKETGYVTKYQEYFDKDSIMKIIPFIQPSAYKSYNLDNNILLNDELQFLSIYLTMDIYYDNISGKGTYQVSFYFTEIPDFVFNDIIKLLNK